MSKLVRLQDIRTKLLYRYVVTGKTHLLARLDKVREAIDKILVETLTNLGGEKNK